MLYFTDPKTAILMRNFCLILFVVLATTDFLSAQCLQSNRAGIHVVQSGETLYRVSRTYGVTIDQLRQWNNLDPGEFLPVCKELLTAAPRPENYTNTSRRIVLSQDGVTLQPRSGTATPTTSSSVAYQKQEGNVHTVQPGQTAAGLAQLYGYTEARFREFNAMGSEELTPGSTVLSTDCSCARISYERADGLGYQGGARNGGIVTGTNTWTEATTRQPDNFGFDLPRNQSGNTNSGTTRNRPADSNVNANAASGTFDRSTASYMNSEELDMIDEINLMRRDPQGYIQHVQDYARRANNGQGWPVSMATVDELIGELRRAQPMSQLQPMPCVYEAARKHGTDIRQRGSSGHVGSDGSYPWDRVLRECPQLTDGNENLVAGPDNVRDAVIMLLIDDNIQGRGHRRTLMEPKWRYNANYKIGQVGRFPNSWVQKFAQ